MELQGNQKPTVGIITISKVLMDRVMAQAAQTKGPHVFSATGYDSFSIILFYVVSHPIAIHPR